MNEEIRKQFDIIANQYDEGRRCFIPCFDDYYSQSLSIVKCFKQEAKSIADLGAGTGLLTKQMYELYPEAKFTLIDLSEEMLSVAKKRFAGLSNFEYLTEDYSAHLASKYDIICSALSIHHLENDVKQSLYTSIYEALPSGGCFVTLDQFRALSPLAAKAEDDWWMDYIDGSSITPEAKAKWIERKKLDREISVEQTVEMLCSAGFTHVECYYKFMKFASIIAIK